MYLLDLIESIQNRAARYIANDSLILPSVLHIVLHIGYCVKTLV